MGPVIPIPIKTVAVHRKSLHATVAVNSIANYSGESCLWDLWPSPRCQSIWFNASALDHHQIRIYQLANYIIIVFRPWARRAYPITGQLFN